jgi:hypothetical protein
MILIEVLTNFGLMLVISSIFLRSAMLFGEAVTLITTCLVVRWLSIKWDPGLWPVEHFPPDTNRYKE